MKTKSYMALAAALLLALVPMGSLAEESRTLTGEYFWSGSGADGPLEAVFTPAGEERWSVDFNFVFRGRDHTYSGTATGSLDEGRLSGTVRNESEKRTFTFEGSFTEGAFSGTHAETTRGEPRSTGTLTLSP